MFTRGSAPGLAGKVGQNTVRLDGPGGGIVDTVEVVDREPSYGVVLVPTVVLIVVNIQVLDHPIVIDSRLPNTTHVSDNTAYYL